MKPTVTADLEWVDGQHFDARAGGHGLTLDGESEKGLSPMQHLALGIAGCMGIDVVHILGRMRQAPDALRVAVEATRADEEPRRFTRVVLSFEIEGDTSEANVVRALELSRDRYCSAWATIRTDTELELRHTIIRPPAA